MFSFEEEVKQRMIRYSILTFLIVFLYQLKFSKVLLEDLRIFFVSALLVSQLLYWNNNIWESLPSKKLKRMFGITSYCIITAICMEFMSVAFLFGTTYEDNWTMFSHLFYLLIPISTCLSINDREYRIMNRRQLLFMNIVCFLIPVIWIIYYLYGPFLLHSHFLPPIAGFCTFYMLFLEYCIYTGALPTYSFYNEIFEKASIEMVLYDHHDRSVFHSHNAALIDEDKRNILKERESSLTDGNYEIHSHLMPGGYALWRMDIREELELQKELTEIKKQLSEEYHFLEVQSQGFRSLAKIREKTRIYDRISKELLPENEKLLSLFSEIESRIAQEIPCQMLLKKACFFAVYIKRKSNLILLSEINEAMTTEELGLCLRESLKYLSACDINGSYYIEDEQEISSDNIFWLYDSFQKIVEYLIDDLSDLFVSIKTDESRILMRLELGKREGSFQEKHFETLYEMLNEKLKLTFDEETCYVDLICERSVR